MTSRSHQMDLDSCLGPWIPERSKFSIENESARKDIRTYIRKRLQRDPGFEDWQSLSGLSFLEEIENKLIEKSGVM